MRDTAQLMTLAAYLTDSMMMPRARRAQLFRTWGSVLAMLPVGGWAAAPARVWSAACTPGTHARFLLMPADGSARHLLAARQHALRHQLLVLQAGCVGQRQLGAGR
jgi:hypothetical protein